MSIINCKLRHRQELELVADAEVIASKLMMTVGQRFSYYLKNISPDVGVLILAQMPTLISTWINSQVNHHRRPSKRSFGSAKRAKPRITWQLFRTDNFQSADSFQFYYPV